MAGEACRQWSQIAATINESQLKLMFIALISVSSFQMCTRTLILKVATSWSSCSNNSHVANIAAPFHCQQSTYVHAVRVCSFFGVRGGALHLYQCVARMQNILRLSGFSGIASLYSLSMVALSCFKKLTSLQIHPPFHCQPCTFTVAQ